MRKWKPLVLCAFFAITSACDTGGVFIDSNCRVGDNSCPVGAVCVGLWGNHDGAAGVCQTLPREAEPECRVGDNSCPKGLECVGIDSNQAGAPGVCKAKPVVERCLVGDDAPCGPGYVCEGIDRNEAGFPGFCRDIAECRVGDDTPCLGEGYGCVGTPGAPIGSPGTCQDIAECRVGDDSKCKTGEVCIGNTNNGWGAAGTCQKDTLGEECETDEDCIEGQACEDNLSGVKRCAYVTSLTHFQILVKNNFVMPLRSHGVPQDNADAGWVGPIAAQMRVISRGPGANTGLYAYTSAGFLNPTACSATAVCTDNCQWVCTLPAGWAGAGPTTAVRVGLSTTVEQLWTYRVSPPPTLSFQVPTTAAVGSAFRVCVRAATTGAPLETLTIDSLQLWDTPPLPATPSIINVLWNEEVVGPREKCRVAHLPLGLSWLGEISLKISATATDTVGNSTQASHDKPLELTRVACERALAGNDVKPPLVFANGHLVFAAGTELHVFETGTCSIAGILLTGTVRGPMVALGDGTLAIATTGRGGPRGRWTPRLLMVNAAAEPPVFMQNPEEDCAIGMAGTHSAAYFERGLSLMSLSPLRYAAPAETATDSVLVAYTPFAAAAQRCVGSGTIDRPFALTTAQTDKNEVLVAYGSLYGNTLKTLVFDGSQWKNGNWTANSVSTGTLNGVALDSDGDVWLSADTASTMAALQAWRQWDPNPIQPYGGPNSYNFFPAVLDSQGRAYVVNYNMQAKEYQLHLINTINSSNNIGVTIPTGNATGMVGSPLLGQPPSGNNADAEVYVISNNGRVFGYKSSDLSRLWTVDLGFVISNTAQPVLVPHVDGGGTMWVVGFEGQVRGIRVNSHGLNRSSPWPKAFRDNCNTSNRLVSPMNMPNCF